ncbi:hypothetical protein ACFLQ3_00795 [Bacteroidota bacterium]
MKRCIKLSLTGIILMTFFTFSSCDKSSNEILNQDDVSISYRISKIYFEREAYSYFTEYSADLSYKDDKLNTVSYRINSSSDTSYIRFDYEINSVFQSFYNSNKEFKSRLTAEFENNKLVFWMIEEDNYNELEPVEKINYNYNGDKLESFLTYDYLNDIWRSYMEGNFSYNNDQLNKYKLYFNWNEGPPEEYAVENTYIYENNEITFIERIDFGEDGAEDETYHYYFKYEGSNLNQIENYLINIEDMDSTLYKSFKFSYDMEGRVQTTLYEDFNYNTKSVWTFEYEEGTGNIKFDKNKLAVEIIDWHQLEFNETIINDFFIILPK